MPPNSIKRFACFATLLLAPFIPFSHAQQGTFAMDLPHIQATINRNNTAVAEGNIAAILSTYEANATMVPQPGTLVEGTDALREAFKQFTALHPKITVIKQDLVQSQDIALHTYTWTMTGKTPDGHPIEQNGFSIIVLRKQVDGKWQIVIDNPFGDALLKAN